MERITGFKKDEVIAIILIFVFIFAAYGFNLSASIKRGRDLIRKDHLSVLQKSLDSYFNKYKIYPLSSDDGKIIGCFDNGMAFLDKKTKKPANAEVCEWGKATFENMVLPADPLFQEGYSYLYYSDGESYQIYVSLEGKREPEYDFGTEKLNLHCGVKICNYGRKV